ncbi:ABC transporter substrate-binding protein [Spirochaeta thermophila]|uniref:Alpha-glucosides-binding periplasmic protein AglE n=1 Tax=Winmispira thermophila (strain ATCC 49972 / DSM 6192 / RI 19.B1) TaxID=665571 RepID=E0RTR9_WINT6|nr:ABC transporter substrate-binding protein [Spirochaeta thermophila]ADN02444.1 alpha-glucosides-binding periplasmic protein AglE precursor [Spirochaeta thermophila DSM 6192]
MRRVALFLLVISSACSLLLATGTQEQQQTGGRVVRVFGAFRGEEAARFEEAIRPFEDRTGIDVVYEGSPEFETQIFVQVEAGTPPDIAALPQPGLMKRFAGKGQIIPLPAEVVAKIDQNYKPVWKELGSYEGKVYGVFHRVNIKSLVWYPKKFFESKGWKIPATWDELMALTEQIAAEGYAPWSIGMESGTATGWVATDWMEDIMLRTGGPEVYDKWVNHEIPFNHPAVRRAGEIMMQIWGNERYVLGGPQNILTTRFQDAVLPLFENPPRAVLHRQGNFVTGFMPEEIQANLDEEVGVFALPSIDPRWGTPVLGGGDQFVMFRDTPEVRAFLEFLTTWDSAKIWAQAGGALFPYKNQDLDDYSSQLERKMAEILVNADVFRFDASDLMPAEVGAGTFWTGMADLVSGVPLETVLDQIEASWPR